MLELKDLFAALKATGYPVKYHHFDSPPPSIPYIVYFCEGYEVETADDVNWSNVQQIRVELYTKTKNLTAEAAVEQVLNDLGLVFSKPDEIWINEEQIYEIIYETELI